MPDITCIVDPDFQNHVAGGHVPLWRSFPSGEGIPQVDFLDALDPKNPLVILWGLHPHTGKKFFELAQLIFAIQEKCTNPLHLFVPFLPFGRMEGNPSFCHHIPRHLKALGVARLLTLDPHGPDPFGFVESISLKPLWQDLFPGDIPIVLPDQGAKTRFDFPEKNPIFLNKERHGDTLTLNGPPVNAKRVLIVDDLVDSGKTLAETTYFLKNQGVERMDALVTHGIFSPGALERLAASDLTTLYCANTIVPVPQHRKITSLSVLEFALLSLKKH